MNNRKMRSTLFLALFTPFLVSASGLSDSVIILCSVTHTIECDAGSRTCYHGSSTAVNLPPFLTIDLEAGEIGTTEAYADVFDQPTKVIHSEVVGSRLILNGIDGRRGWSAVIDVETGGMTIMVGDHDGGFVVFGVCMEMANSDR